jgi:hypothetical protein
MANDRRDFFKTVGAATAAAMLSTTPRARAATEEKYVAAYRHALLLEGGISTVDELLAFDGGDVRGVVVKGSVTNGVVEKHLSEFYFSDFALLVGTGISVNLYNWIQGMFNLTAPKRSGSLVAADKAGSPRSRVRFLNAALTEVTFPALDARSRAAAAIELLVTPAGGQLNSSVATIPALVSKPKSAWLCGNFRLSISNLAEACARVTKIDAFTVKQNYPPASGGFRDVTQNPDPVDVSNLVFYVPEEFAGPFRDWAYDFLINGNRSNAAERSGTLEFLSPNLKTVYYTLSFNGLGIFGCALEADDMKLGINRLVKVELYCETVSLTVGPLGT